MQLNSLYICGFRNYEETTANFVSGVNLIVGDNANGKTNLLEAISYLSVGHAFRTRKEQELIRFGADFAEISAKLFSQEREQELRAVLFSGRKPRQLFLNGVKQKTAAGISGVLTSVLFCPEEKAARHRIVPDAAELCAGSGGISENFRSEKCGFKG